MSDKPGYIKLPWNEVYLTEREVAMMLHLSPNALGARRARRTGPPFIKLSPRCIRYRLSDVEKWLAERSEG